jgi:RNA polymerase sigma factor (TIGR02999 family)
MMERGEFVDQRLQRETGVDDPASKSALSEDTYRRLRTVARQQLRRFRPGATLDTTALVHDTWIRLAGGGSHAALPRDEFLKLASTAMRRLIIDYARRRGAQKRGGDICLVEFDVNAVESGALPVLDVVAVDAALRDLGRLDPHLEQLVECRFFAGLTMEEAAHVLQRPMRSLERDWARARAYLVEALDPSP